MAKLPDIQYGQVSLPEGRGPQDAVAKAQGIAGIANVVQKTLSGIAAIRTENSVASATANTQIAMNDYQESQAGVKGYTADEVRDLGMDAHVTLSNTTDENGEAVDRAFIPKHEIEPMLLDRELERVIASQAGEISNKAERAAWERDMQVKRSELVANSVVKAENDAVEFAMVKTQFDIARAQDSGAFESAADLIRTGISDPNQKREALQANEVLKQDYRVSQQLLKGTPDTQRNLAAYYTMLPAEDNPWDAKHTVTQVSSLIAAATAHDKALKTAKVEEQDQAFRDSLEALSTGKMTLAEVHHNKESYKPKDYSALITVAQKPEKMGMVNPYAFIQYETNTTLLEQGVFDPTKYQTHSEAVAAARSELMSAFTYSQDGVPQPQITAEFLRESNTRLNAAVEFQYSSPSYDQVTRELSLRILGQDAGGGFSFFASDTSRQDYADALVDLHAFISADPENAATSAVKWRETNMPKFFSDDKIKGRMGLSASMDPIVVLTNGEVDWDMTETQFKAKVKAIRGEIMFSPAEKAAAEAALVADYNSFQSNWSTEE